MDLTKLKIAFITFSSIIFALFVASIIQDGDREWKEWQTKFFEMEKERGVSRDYSMGLKQIWLEHQGRTDRCVTCHVGMRDIDTQNPYGANPFKTHPDNDFIHAHRPEKFGCTVCHDGQGLATTTIAAHGHVKSWDWPMLEKEYVQASCTKCHDPNALPQGTEWIGVGKALANQYGCLGCHSLNGQGGKLCPDLTGIGSKSDSEWANTHHFNHVEGEKTKQNWVYQHFLDPLKVTPGNKMTGEAPTVMPNFKLTPTLAKALTIYIMSLKNVETENLPSQWMAKAPVASAAEAKK